MKVESKQEVKKYFFPVYWIWAIIIPIFFVGINAYLDAGAGENFGESFSNFTDEISWSRVPAMFALFGLIYPLTIVIFPGFYISFTEALSMEKQYK